MSPEELTVIVHGVLQVVVVGVLVALILFEKDFESTGKAIRMLALAVIIHAILAMPTP